MVLPIESVTINAISEQICQQVENLLVIHPDNIQCLFEEVGCSAYFSTCAPDDNTGYTLNEHNFRFYLIKFDQTGNVDLDRFVSNLKPIIGKYCIPRWKQKTLSEDSLYQQARQTFTSSPTTGEPGELLIYALIEAKLKAPKIVAKMSLKTNPKMPVYGSDGIHLGVKNQNLLLIFGESKLVSDRKQAISNALTSIHDFIHKVDPDRQTSVQHYELNFVLVNQIDVEEPLRAQLMSILDPYDRAQQIPRKYVCFIGYDQASAMRKKYSNDKEFLEKISDEMIQKAASTINELFCEDQFRKIKDLDFEFFIVPFNTIDEFRSHFIDQIVKGNQ